MKLQRLLAFWRKEFLQMVRDPSSVVIAFVLPLLLLLLFGYAISFDLRRAPLALVVERPSEPVRELLSGFPGSEAFRPRFCRSLREAEEWLERGEVKGLLYLREDFRRRPALELIVDGIDANTARIFYSFALATLHLPAQEIQLEPRFWFNETARSRLFLVPGLLAVIMTLVGAMLTALVVAREWERGTIEMVLATPLTRLELLLGKLIPYLLFGSLGWLFSLLLTLWLFGVPLRGSLAALGFGSTLFLLTMLGLGLWISATTRNQFLASQIAVLSTYLPAFLLSGFLFEIGSMPLPIQGLTYLVPARYYVPILLSEFLVGHTPSLFWPNAAVLALMALLFLALAFSKLKKEL